MSLHEFWGRIKRRDEETLSETFSLTESGEVGRNGLAKRLFLPLLVILVAFLSFGLGRLSGEGGTSPIKIEYDPSLSAFLGEASLKESPEAIRRASSPADERTAAAVVASKNGSKYHYLHCPGAKQIKEENKLHFPSREAAEASGYSLAGNCEPK